MSIATINAQFRSPKPLNLRLRQGVNDHFDNRQYAEGFKLLRDLVTTGYSAFGHTNGSPSLPTWVPDAQHLALAATVMVHPHFTTRARSYEQHTKGSQEALRLLVQVNAIIGPINADLVNALAFKTNVLRRATQKIRQRVDLESRSPGTPDLEAGDESTTSVFANEKSILNQRADFWNVVGWSFNCSSAYQQRWVYWQIWLSTLFDVIERDWQERLRIAHESESSKSFQTGSWALKTLMLKYTKQLPNGNDVKRYLRAIFANGVERCMNEFPEVWVDETKELRKQDDERKRKDDVDLDNDIWGDYDQVEEELEGDLIASSQPVYEVDLGGLSNSAANRLQSDSLGGIQVIELRWRLIGLLLTVANAVPAHFTKSEVILDNLVYAMRELSYDSFVDFLRSSSSLGHLHAPFLVNFLIGLTSINVKTNIFAMSKQLELSLFSLPANTADPTDNAKVSRILIALLQALHRSSKISISSDRSELRAAIQKGIAERHAKVTQNKKSREETKTAVALTRSDKLLIEELAMIEDEAGFGPGISFVAVSIDAKRGHSPGPGSSSLSSLDFSETSDTDEAADETLVE